MVLFSSLSDPVRAAGFFLLRHSLIRFLLFLYNFQCIAIGGLLQYTMPASQMILV